MFWKNTIRRYHFWHARVDSLLVDRRKAKNFFFLFALQAGHSPNRRQKDYAVQIK